MRLLYGEDDSPRNGSIILILGQVLYTVVVDERSQEKYA